MIEKSKFSNGSFMVGAYLIEDFLMEATVMYDYPADGIDTLKWQSIEIIHFSGN